MKSRLPPWMPPWICTIFGEIRLINVYGSQLYWRINVLQGNKVLPQMIPYKDSSDREGAPTPNVGEKTIVWQDFFKNCLKMKEIGPRRERP